MVRSLACIALFVATGCIVGAYSRPVPPVEQQRATLLTGSKEGYRIGEISEDLGLISKKAAVAATHGHWLTWLRGDGERICFERGFGVSEDKWGLRDRERRTTKDLQRASFYVQAHDSLDGKPTWQKTKSAVRSV